MLSELCTSYLEINTAVKSQETARLMRLSVRHFSTFLARDAMIVDLTDRNLALYVQYRRHLGMKDSTIEREQAKLWTLAKWACLHGHIKPLYSRPFKAVVDTPIGFTPDELRRLFRSAFRYRADVGGVPGEVYMPALVYTFWDTLDRSGCIWSVTRADLDVAGKWWWPRRGWITLRVRKGGGRTLRRRLRWRTTRYLRRLLRAHDHDLIFSLGRHRTTLYHHWGRLLRSSGIPDDRHHGPHCLRRTGGSRFQAAGGRAQEVLDHADEKTTRVHYLVPWIVGEAQPLDRLRDPLGLFSRILGWVGL